jgi:hypothetical protein
MTRRLRMGIINLAALVVMVVINALAVILPINNRTTQELSDAYPNLFTPSGMTFSIWGLIYLLLAVFCIFSLIPKVWRSSSRGSFIDRVGWLFFISCIFNGSWIFSWHYEMVPLSVLIMLALLVTLIAIYARLNVGKSNAQVWEKYLVHLPFSVYLGWISVAAIANITVLLVFSHWNGLGMSEQFWTITVITVAIILAIVVIIRQSDIYYALVVGWALLGILLKRLADDSQPDRYVGYAAIAGIVVITSGVLLKIIKRSNY